MGRPAGMLCRFTCRACGREELTRGGNDSFRCSDCRPALDPFVAAKRAAHKAVADARRAGILPAPSESQCTDCGAVAIEYDHRDYSQPLNVQPVCRGCNLRRGPALSSGMGIQAA